MPKNSSIVTKFIVIVMVFISIFASTQAVLAFGNNKVFNLVWSPNSQYYLTQETTPNGQNIAYLGFPGLKDYARVGVELITPAWSPDSKFIAYFRNQTGQDSQGVTDFKGNLYVLPLATGIEQQLTHFELGEYGTHPVWSPDGKFITFSYKNGNIAMINLDTQKWVIQTTGKIDTPMSWVGNEIVFMSEGREKFGYYKLNVTTGVTKFYKEFENKPFEDVVRILSPNWNWVAILDQKNGTLKVERSHRR